MALLDWHRHYDGPIAAPVNLLVNPDNPSEVAAPAAWIELPGGGTVTILRWDNDQEILTWEGSKIWIRTIRQIIESDCDVNVGTGSVPTSQAYAVPPPASDWDEYDLTGAMPVEFEKESYEISIVSGSGSLVVATSGTPAGRPWSNAVPGDVITGKASGIVSVVGVTKVRVYWL